MNNEEFDLEKSILNLTRPSAPSDPRELEIYNDIFRSDETDFEYFLRRKKELEKLNED